MRKWNAVITAGILLLFLVHLVTGALQTAGFLSGGNIWLKWISWVMLALIGLHMLIGIKLTADTLRIQQKSGASYPRENRLFWARRISGFALMAFLVCHVLIFSGTTENGAFRLHLFAGAELVTQILLIVSLGVHILTNLTPLLIGLGIRSFRTFLPDLLAILAVLLLVGGVGFVVYYIRWNVL
jgi:hypothetical protein